MVKPRQTTKKRLSKKKLTSKTRKFCGGSPTGFHKCSGRVYNASTKISEKEADKVIKTEAIKVIKTEIERQIAENGPQWNNMDSTVYKRLIKDIYMSAMTGCTNEMKEEPIDMYLYINESQLKDAFKNRGLLSNKNTPIYGKPEDIIKRILKMISKTAYAIHDASENRRRHQSFAEEESITEQRKKGPNDPKTREGDEFYNTKYLIKGTSASNALMKHINEPGSIKNTIDLWQAESFIEDILSHGEFIDPKQNDTTTTEKSQMDPYKETNYNIIHFNKFAENVINGDKFRCSRDGDEYEALDGIYKALFGEVTTIKYKGQIIDIPIIEDEEFNRPYTENNSPATDSGDHYEANINAIFNAFISHLHPVYEQPGREYSFGDYEQILERIIVNLNDKIDAWKATVDEDQSDVNEEETPTAVNEEETPTTVNEEETPTTDNEEETPVEESHVTEDTNTGGRKSKKRRSNKRKSNKRRSNKKRK